ncbi:SDR family oxidoreductase [Paraperlucidibaca sp.]|jgi:citronellol/citronellal dehydrogenase|uniref:SDR family oxidoreductase n=1 Tax=Paraperlucidibaca sp. TaxID=2708021 RepID=UPI003989D2B3|tara:strand:- start:1743 stop:2573 length:831 start_codon:yes stop_codon:yes gene_type:complete
MSAWQGKTLFMTGGSRGIGREIALRFAREGANVVIAAKTDQPHARLPGTVHSVAEEIKAAGGQALALVVDARDEAQLVAAIAQTIEHFGGIDVLVNNAGFIGVTPIAATQTKHYDLMHALNSRAPMITMRECLPHLLKSGGQVLNLCPPINLDPGWLGAFAPYTSTKYAMTLLSLGFQQEVANRGVQVRTLWPATLIATAAVGMTAGEAGLAMARKPAIMADAAYALLTECERFANEVCWLDETALRHIGVTEFDGYANDPSQAANIQRDFYVGTF